MAKSPKRRKRQPDITREKLLAAAFDEIYRRGFQAASLDAILAQAGVTKGALYHHFPDKAALGRAVIDDVVRDLLLERWLGVLEAQKGDPLTALQGMLAERWRRLEAEEVELGCPLNNLAQEMSPLDEGFRRRLEKVYSAWREGLESALARGIKAGTVRKGISPRKVAALVVAALEGIIGTAKNAQSMDLLELAGEGLFDYLDTLRP